RSCLGALLATANLLTHDFNSCLFENVAHLDSQVIEELIQAVPGQISVLELIIVQILLPTCSLGEAAKHSVPILHHVITHTRRRQHSAGLRNNGDCRSDRKTA